MFTNLFRIKHYLMDVLRLIYFSISNKRYRANRARYKSCDNKKPKSLMKSELCELKKHWGCFPMQYYTHDFYRNDCPLSLEVMKSYIPSYYFYKVLYPQIDPKNEYEKVLGNKITTHYLFKGMGIQGSAVVLVVLGGNVYDSSGKTISNELEYKETLSKNSTLKLFIKPVSGKGGAGILIGKRLGDEYYINEKLVDLDFFLSLCGDYIVEAQVVQSQAISEVYSSSVNTLRAITKRNANGYPELAAIVLRMGVGGSELDNASLGGLILGINLENGKSLTDYACYEFGVEKFHQHPDSGYEFSKFQVPNWEYVKEKIIDSSNSLIFHQMIGWDIAITDEGIVAIEANTGFALDLLQSALGGMKDCFVDGSPKDRLFH